MDSGADASATHRAEIEALRAENAALREALDGGPRSPPGEDLWTRPAEPFRTLVEAASQILWTADAEGRFVGDSPSWRAFTGQSLDDWFGNRWADMVHPDDRDDASDAWRTAIAGGAPVAARFRLHHAPTDGWRWVQAHATPLRDAEGTVTGFVGMNTDVTAVQEAEDALRQSEERYRLLVESATEYAILMLDREGCITSWNSGAERIFGYTEAEALGQSGTLIFTPEDRAEGVPEREMATAVRDGHAHDDRWHLRQDGSRFWATGVMTALYTPDGAPRGFAKILRDNTLRKTVEDALRESEARLQLALDASRTGTHTYDPETDTHALDARACEITGFERPFSIGAWIDRVHPADRARVEASAAGAMDPAADGLFDDEYRLVAPDGSVRWVYVRSQTHFTGEGDDRRPARVVGTVQDVTARKQTEAALRASEERFRRMAAAVPDVLFTADADGRVDYVNEQFETLTGQPRTAGLGTPLWPDLVHPDDRADASARWAQAQEAGVAFENRHRLLTPSGDVHVITRAVPVRTPDRALGAWFGTVTDIDNLARSEGTVRRLNATLEDRVAARTRQVRRLSAKLAEAEQLERQRLALVLHDDLQQQLAALSLTLQLAQTAPTGHERQSLHERSLSILDSATALTRSLTSELSPPVLGSDRLVDLLRWLARRAQERHRLEVSVSVAAGCTVPDSAVRALLVHAVNEILFNVVKHARTPRADLHAQRRGDVVTVTVADDGAGFDVSAMEQSESRGFGLFSIRERVELVGGHLGVQSAPGQGTTITLNLPCGEEDALGRSASAQ